MRAAATAAPAAPATTQYSPNCHTFIETSTNEKGIVKTQRSKSDAAKFTMKMLRGESIFGLRRICAGREPLLVCCCVCEQWAALTRLVYLCDLAAALLRDERVGSGACARAQVNERTNERANE